jgi:hypothetical protein
MFLCDQFTAWWQLTFFKLKALQHIGHTLPIFHNAVDTAMA